MSEEQPTKDWRVVLVATDGAKCRKCGRTVRNGERAWYLPGKGLQHLECGEDNAEAGDDDV
jgi:hypothetical protein